MKKPKKLAPRGFALVVTLSLMILLTVIAVGLLSLSSISLRASSQGDSMATARSNARMALMLAIGELQREMGPDSRISAPHNAGNVATGGSPHWTAVYDAWKWNSNPSSPESPSSRSPDFRSWLVSGVNPATGGSGGSGETALLVGPGSLGTAAPASDQVRVPMHAVNHGNHNGRLAWWTSDESLKAKVNAGPDLPQNGVSNPLFQAQSPPNVNQKAIPALEAFDWKKGQRVMALSQGQVNLAAGLGLSGVGSAFHDITVHSAGVLADVRSGRLKRDLSNLLSRDVTSLEDKPLYLSDGRMNLLEIGEDGGVARKSMVTSSITAQTTAAEWGINLEELHLFHSLHRQLDWSGGAPRLVVKNSREEVVKDRHYLYRKPMVDAVQFIFSLKAVPSATAGKYRMEMMLDAVVALANPYDVPIQWPAGLELPMLLQRLPYRMKWKITDGGGNLKNENQSDVPTFGLFIGRVGGGVSSAAKGFTLEPGESAAFGSSIANGQNLDLLRGFAPKGGVRMQQDKWNLQADGLDPTDNIDFTMEKVGNVVSGTHSYLNMYVGIRKITNPEKGWVTNTSSLAGGGDFNSDEMNAAMPPQIRPPGAITVEEFLKDSKPKPFLMLNFLTNVEQSSGALTADAFASRPLLMNEPAAWGRSFTPATVQTARHSSQLLITVEPMNYQFKTLAGGQGGGNFYHGGSREPQLGSTRVIRRRVPIAPPLSLGAFENAIASGFSRRFNYGGGYVTGDTIPSNAVALSGADYGWPLAARAVGNSWSNPLLPSGQVHKAGSGTGPDQRAATDHSWMANSALWDSWFLSGIVDGKGIDAGSWFQDSRSPREQFSDLAKGTGSLRNNRFVFFDHKTADQALEELFESSGNFKPGAINKLANYLMVDGAFNVNSTSVNAWAAFLSSVRDQEILTPGGSGQEFEHPVGTLGYAVNTAINGKEGEWSGLRSLGKDEIQSLARAIVTEVKERGPFLNMADFVNRRPNSSEPAHRAIGALQAAINKTGLNDSFTGGDRGLNAADFGSLTGASVAAAEPKPSRSAGAAGYLSQAMLLTPMGSQITVRGDTFTIRAYGDTRNAANKIIAKAWCEAVIQRAPEYVDPSNAPEAQDGWPASSSKLSAVNALFGRRMELVSFRWLNPAEI